MCYMERKLSLSTICIYLPMYMTFNIYVVLGINVIGSFIGRGIAVIIYNKYYVIMLFDLVDLVGISMEKRH